MRKIHQSYAKIAQNHALFLLQIICFVLKKWSTREASAFLASYISILYNKHSEGGRGPKIYQKTLLPRVTYVSSPLHVGSQSCTTPSQSASEA